MTNPHHGNLAPLVGIAHSQRARARFPFLFLPPCHLPKLYAPPNPWCVSSKRRCCPPGVVRQGLSNALNLAQRPQTELHPGLVRRWPHQSRHFGTQRGLRVLVCRHPLMSYSLAHVRSCSGTGRCLPRQTASTSPLACTPKSRTRWSTPPSDHRAPCRFIRTWWNT